MTDKEKEEAFLKIQEMKKPVIEMIEIAKTAKNQAKIDELLELLHSILELEKQIKK